MFRYLSFIVALAAGPAGSALVFAQTPPPGAPFDATKHPNPVITFVETKSFKSATSAVASEESGVELLGISLEEGKRESVEIAPGRFVRNMSILGIRTDVTFYPVVLQKFELAGGDSLLLYSFRFPKVALPPDFTRIVLNEAAVEKKKKASEMRFGGEKPETLEIRGAPGLLFETDGKVTVYWQENGAGHAATARMPRSEVFHIIEDLL